MPEGHSVHRLARRFDQLFVGRQVSASSPQGRFAGGATLIDGRWMTRAIAVGKHMFLEFDNDLWLHVHLGLYGAWDFAGDIHAEALSSPSGEETVVGEHEDSLSSIGAPRRARLRVSEDETLTGDSENFPAAPVGAVRVRLLTHSTVADLRGPTACDVLRAEEVQAKIDTLGPDPILDSGRKAENRFVASVMKRATPIGLLLMDQSVVAGIGNVYRAEILFRARLNPYTRGRDLDEKTVRALWKDWAKLLKIGVDTGQMLTRDNLGPNPARGPMARRANRHWVYHREGLPCRVCDFPIVMDVMGARKLYWCPQDQV
ncbi:formamidopyrimidine-DNA glycosylase [Salinibacterium sp. CAN_S4]|uniref:Fpg/Nei family DNA glycosylase n=1 Tax=Salinibacterium sp. CAN_S4 TaxID=2787727 RepID=UPI0018F0361F